MSVLSHAYEHCAGKEVVAKADLHHLLQARCSSAQLVAQPGSAPADGEKGQQARCLHKVESTRLLRLALRPWQRVRCCDWLQSLCMAERTRTLQHHGALRRMLQQNSYSHLGLQAVLRERYCTWPAVYRRLQRQHVTQVSAAIPASALWMSTIVNLATEDLRALICLVVLQEYYPGDMTVFEQYKLFQHSHIIAAPHGAHLM